MLTFDFSLGLTPQPQAMIVVCSLLHHTFVIALVSPKAALADEPGKRRLRALKPAIAVR